MVLEIRYLEHSDTIQVKDLVLSLGFFDGLHLAHMKLIEEASMIAKEKNLPLAVFTFSMSVKSFVRNQRHRCLTTIEDKAKLLEKYNVDYLYVMKVSEPLIKMNPQEFIDRFLKETHTVVCGFDFTFGYHGEGNVDLLKKQTNFKTKVVEEIKYEGFKIGSSKIKQVLEVPDLEFVKNLLGRNYSIKGKVISGRRVGRRLGFPTANIDYVPYFLPVSGVYLTKVICEDKTYYGATNIGTKPTYYHLPLSVETYIFDLNRNLYNHEIKIEFLDFIRPELKFTTEKELIDKINEDVLICKKLVKEKYHD